MTQAATIPTTRTNLSWPILALFAGLAIAMTWPLLLRIGTHVPAGTHDIWQNYWNLWWWKTALCERHQSPYTTDLLFFPQTVPLGNHTHSPANMLWTLPVNLFFGVPVALNLAVLAGFVFSGYGAFLLAREYTHRTGPAIVAGIAFAYLPQHVEQALEHLNLASYQAMPFFLWALVRTVRLGGRWWIATGLFFALNALFSWHNGLLVLPLGVGVFALELYRTARSRKRVIIELSLAAVLAALVISPFLWPILRDTFDEVAVLQKAFPDKPIKPAFLVVPHPGHPLWGPALADVYREHRSYPSVGFVGYLGVTTLALAALALLGRRGSEADSGPPPGSRRLWFILGAFFLVLSFGEVLRLALPSPGGRMPVRTFEIPLPFHWLKTIPVFGLVRVPNRFLVPASLALAILASMGTLCVTARLPRRRRGVFVWVAAGLVMVDLMWLPFPMREVPNPPWLRALDGLPRNLAVLDIPTSHRARAAEDMLLQTHHGRPLASGYVSTRLRSVDLLLKRFPVLHQIFERYPKEDAFAGPSLVEAIREIGVGIVVVHLDRSVGRILERRENERREHPTDLYRQRLHNPETGISPALLDRFRVELREAFGEPVYTDDDQVEIYLVKK